MKRGLMILIFVVTITFSLNSVVAQSSTTEVQFYNNFGVPYCVNSESDSNWYEDNNVISSVSDCYRESGLPTAYCCPTVGQTECNGDEALSFCEDGPEHCGEIDDPIRCNSGKFNSLASKDLETPKILGDDLFCDEFNGEYGTEGCYNYLACACQWVEDSCQSVYEHQIYVGETSLFYNESNIPPDIEDTCGALEGPNLGQCNFIFSIIDDCETTGFLFRDWVVSGITSDPSCVDGNDKVPCLDVVKLDFFGTLGFVSSIIIIAIVYWFILKKKNKN